MADVRVVAEVLSVASVREFRARPDPAAVAAAIAPCGLGMPAQPNGMEGDAQLACAWIEPHAWLLVSAAPRAMPASTAGVLITDVSDRTAAFRITGPGARDLIAAGCDPAIVTPGRCARTRFAGLANALIQQWAADDYRLLVDVSIADTVAEWLRVSAT